MREEVIPEILDAFAAACAHIARCAEAASTRV